MYQPACYLSVFPANCVTQQYLRCAQQADEWLDAHTLDATVEVVLVRFASLINASATESSAVQLCSCGVMSKPSLLSPLLLHESVQRQCWSVYTCASQL